MPEARDPLRYFRVEARELIDQISAGVLDLDQQPGADQVNKLLRYAHTLKGAARVVRQQEIAERAHAFEEVLVPHRGENAAMAADEMRELLRLNDEIADCIGALETGTSAAPSGPAAMGTAAVGTASVGTASAGTAFAGTASAGTPSAEAAPVEPAPIGVPQAVPSASVPPGSVPSGSVPSGSVPSGSVPSGSVPSESVPSESVPSESGSSPSVPSESVPSESVPSNAVPSMDAAAEAPGPAEMPAPHPGLLPEEIGDGEPAPRAATADLDELLDAIGEASARIAPLREGGRSMNRLHSSAETLADQLRTGRTALTQAGCRHQVQRLAGELGALGRRLTDAVDQVERELDEIRGRAEGLRLIGAGTIFTALHRAVRDAADAEGKRVRFTGRGGDVRMGPQLLNQVNGAFLHVVRNAVVHGIEPEAQRVAAGKPAEGTVIVEVERRGRFVLFRCIDDGRGFDLGALRRTAVSRGLLRPDDPDTDLLDLVLRGGISTSPAVTDVAGRGIGMDVARDVAVQLHGEVTIHNRPGLGATVEVNVPLTLLSMNGLVVEAGTNLATMPLDAIRRCVRLPPEEVAVAAVTGRFAHGGQVLPFLPLSRVLGAGFPAAETASGVAMIVAVDDEVVAVGVDRLAGTTTVVARPLPDLAPAAAVIGSVAIDLDGNPRLVLDAHGLVAEARRGRTAGGAAPEPAVPLPPILVVDDSLTTRMLERSILESAGYEVDLAASGEEGLEKARVRRYGLFLTDIDMPGIDGFTFVAETRADPELAGVPAILVSSRASAADRQRGAEVGASAYVVKGEFDQEELLGHIRRLIRS